MHANGPPPPDKKPARSTTRLMKRSQGFVDEVYELIRADIMSLRIAPDTRISIDELARQIGVSQTPIREALSRLEAVGLVTKRHFAGYCSAPQITRQQLDELYELRLLLEPYAATLRGNAHERCRTCARGGAGAWHAAGRHPQHLRTICRPGFRTA